MNHGESEDKVKSLELVALVTLIAVICVSIGAVSAQSATNEATVTVSLSKYSPAAGEPISVTVTIHNNVDRQLQVTRIGFHADWMSSPNDVVGPILDSNPAAIEANSVYNPYFMVTIPVNTNPGTYNYSVAVYGQDSNGGTYVWESAQGTMQVVTASSAVSPTPTTNNGQPAGSTDYLLYIAIVAIVVMVVLAALVLLMLRKRARARTAPVQRPTSSPSSESPKPEQSPPEQKPSSGENFDI